MLQLLLFNHVCHTLSIASYSFTQLSELGRRGENKNFKASKRHQRGLQLALPRLRARHSIAELLRLSVMNCMAGRHEYECHCTSIAIQR